MDKSELNPDIEGTPLILALETATEASSVSLFAGDRLLGSVEYFEGKSHARLITVMIARLLEDLGIDRKSLSAVSVGRGPGSYTGLRVGVSTAKGLCMALGIPLLSVGSLESLAWQVRDLAHRLDAFICPMIDARRMEVYTQEFTSAGVARSEPYALVVEADAYETLLNEKKVIFVGNGAEKCRELLENSPNAIVLPNIISTSSAMGAISFRKFREQDWEDLVTFEPFYLKDFVATKPKKKML